MGKKSRQKNERQAMAGLVALQRDAKADGIRFAVGIEPGAPKPILFQFKAGGKVILPTSWDVPSARAMAKSLNKYCDMIEQGGDKPSPEAIAKMIQTVRNSQTPTPSV